MYKGNFKPAQVSCPITHNYVTFTEDVRKKISEEKKPNLFKELGKEPTVKYVRIEK